MATFQYLKKNLPKAELVQLGKPAEMKEFPNLEVCSTFFHVKYAIQAGICTTQKRKIFSDHWGSGQCIMDYNYVNRKIITVKYFAHVTFFVVI